MNHLNIIHKMLSKTKIPSSTEEEMQVFIERFFAVHEINYIREHSFSQADRIDFYLPDYKIGIECKISGSPLPIKRQCERYLSHSSCSSLILITSKFMTMPKEILKKEVLVVNVGAAWL